MPTPVHTLLESHHQSFESFCPTQATLTTPSIQFVPFPHWLWCLLLHIRHHHLILILLHLVANHLQHHLGELSPRASLPYLLVLQIPNSSSDNECTGSRQSRTTRMSQVNLLHRLGAPSGLGNKWLSQVKGPRKRCAKGVATYLLSCLALSGDLLVAAVARVGARDDGGAEWRNRCCAWFWRWFWRFWRSCVLTNGTRKGAGCVRQINPGATIEVCGYFIAVF